MTAPAHSSQARLQYGNAFADALHKRLGDHFASLGKEEALQQPPLTIGLFGGWGSGKTRHLEHLRDRTREQTPQDKTITLPILFNAWRHEAEDHLIVPLLKTTHYVLEDWLKQQTPRDEVLEATKNFVGKAAVGLKNAALSLANGFNGKLNVPLIGELEFDFKSMLEDDAHRQAARGPDGKLQRRFKNRFGRNQPSLAASLDKLDAIYHDFETHLRSLTGMDGDGKGTRLNLLFLIDDLDRCLPEKAVQMLESIKLFLDVPGCAFVLALDDEVVERGIAHRYRDYKHDEPAWDSVAHALNPENFNQYRAERDHQRVGPTNPVSGHEYLEKMVHLPLYVPVPNRTEVRTYLIERFPELFALLPEREETDDTENLADDRKSRPPQPDRNTAENAIRNKLLDLIERAVPKNPRKLNRLAELYAFKIEVARGNDWKIETETEQLTLMRLCAVQLLAPEMYRFGRPESQSVFFGKLEAWLKSEDEKAQLSGHLEQHNRELRKKYKAENDINNLKSLERLDEPLLAHLRNAQSQRSGFDPLELLDPDAPCDRNLSNYYRLARTQTSGTGIDTTSNVSATPANLTSPSEFIGQLLSNDPLAWRNALAQEADALAGRVLDEATFAALLTGVREKPQHVSVEWLTPLAPHLSQQQLLKLYEAGKLLQRLNEAVKSGETP